MFPIPFILSPTQEMFPHGFQVGKRQPLIFKLAILLADLEICACTDPKPFPENRAHEAARIPAIAAPADD